MRADYLDILNPGRCCLLVIDPQESLMKAIHKADRVIRNTALMIHCAKAMEIPIIATTQYEKGLGPFVPQLAELLADVTCVDKIEFNALASYNVKQVLTNLPAAVDTLIMVGVETHICIYQTAICAIKMGYRPWIVADAVSSREKQNTKLALSRMEAIGASVGPAEMAVYEMLGKAGTPTFKAMLPHLK
ncbi:MAG: isochorismatase family protein [Thermodesulfobacteriota bacterium]|nr:isochorismatase family protein [Thermodesulfobacteriota bacterium]